ncbi:MAG: PDGLE domain-containing protein [Methanosarcinaceae archaeon]|nr:PDGLE domain-containing protein [Methanosarcinaceae archaeon]MDD4497830.1 PDGLE domain-containing protein [Methanosarcinaceae archaeon]
MNANNMKFLYAGIMIALVISVLAPFLASSDPDGLESAAGGVIDEARMAELEESEPVVGSPMPDYAIEGLGKGGEVAAIALGTLAVLGISFGFGKAFNKKA